jgi:hypothetical protein
MVKIGPYPNEVSFYPDHFVIPLITLLIFVILLYIITRIRRTQGRAQAEERARSEATRGQKPMPAEGDGWKTLDPTKMIDTIRQEVQRGIEKAKEDLTKVQEKKIHITDLGAADVISLVGLIGTIVGALVVPFSQLPILDYTVTGPFPTTKKDTQKFEIAIHNSGTINAENVLVSLKADNTKFSEFSSQPFLANYFIDNASANSGRTGEALIEIKDLPSRSHTIITAIATKVSDDKSEPELTTFVRSDKAVGYHQSFNVAIFYVLLSASYVFFTVMFSTGLINPLRPAKKIEYRSTGTIDPQKPLERIENRLFAIVGILISAGVIASNLLLYLPHLDVGSTLYVVYYYGGVLIVPVTILILAIIYYYRRGYAWDYRLIAIIAGLIVSGIAAASMLIYLPPVDPNNSFYPFYHWLGVLVIPVMVLATMLAYHQYALATLFGIGVITISLISYLMR